MICVIDCYVIAQQLLFIIFVDVFVGGELVLCIGSFSLVMKAIND